MMTTPHTPGFVMGQHVQTIDGKRSGVVIAVAKKRVWIKRDSDGHVIPYQARNLREVGK